MMKVIFAKLCVWNANFELELAKISENRERIYIARSDLARWKRYLDDIHLNQRIGELL